MTYKTAKDFLLNTVDYEKVSRYTYNSSRFNLDRMARLLEVAGNPHLNLKTIHVAGTKGKGSTSIMIASLLMGSGLKVGLFTSPHLINLEERIQVDGREISSNDLCETINVFRPWIEEEQKRDLYLSPTFFETLTAVSLLFFKNKAVDVAVMEVGLGGRLDATNIIMPLVSVITSIGFDHTDKLGNTLDQIAREKAGIIKDGIPVVSAPQKAEALSVIEGVCNERSAPLLLVGREIICDISTSALSHQPSAFSPVRGSLCDMATPKNRYNELFIPVPGRHQMINSACAVGAAEIAISAFPNQRALLSGKDGVDTVRRSLLSVRCPGRIEVVSQRPLIIIDSAHTVESMRALRETIREYFNPDKVTLILGLSVDKDINGILNEIAPFVDYAVFTPTGNPRSAAPEDLANRCDARLGGNCSWTSDIEEGIRIALKVADGHGIVCVTGSTYLAGKAKCILRNDLAI